MRERSPPKKSPSPTLEAKPTIIDQLENLEKEETAAVASMLNKVEWKNTPVYKQHINNKVTEAESLKGTSIGIRRYKELAKTKGKTMG